LDVASCTKPVTDLCAITVAEHSKTISIARPALSKFDFRISRIFKIDFGMRYNLGLLISHFNQMLILGKYWKIFVYQLQHSGKKIKSYFTNSSQTQHQHVFQKNTDLSN
jgi:hypothetical protein